MQPDTYWSTPQMPLFEDRRKLFLEYCVANPDGWRLAFTSQIARLELGLPINEALFMEGLDYVDSRFDCCDFAVGVFQRILYLYRNSGLLPQALIARIEDSLLRFKYWWDEPAGDNKRCYWTENHQIIFHADELIASEMFAGKTFINDGKSSEYHKEHALHLIRNWFDYRARFGFSEWLSNCYFEEDLLGVVNLYDFAEQEDIRQLAKQTIDLILFEMALHSYRGVMGCSHGRTYPRLIKGARNEDASNTAKLMFGMGMYNKSGVLGTNMLATSTYRCPPIIVKIAQDLQKPILIKERHSFNIEDAPSFGLTYDQYDHGNLYWSIQDYTNEKSLALIQDMTKKFSIGFEDYSARYEQVRRDQIARYGKVVDPNIDCHAMTEVHVQTYRTPNYLLSCAQDFRPGRPGYQQHPWQATLGIDAMVFTNHPGSMDEMSRPNYWAGNGLLPRAVQQQNVLVCLHHVLADDALPFSHAYFPRDAFDEVVEQNGWIFGRLGDGYLGLYVQNGYRWITEKDGPTNEVRSDHADTAWIVEMGEKGQWADFSAFIKAVSSAAIVCQGLHVTYQSPTQGSIEFGWEGDFKVKGQVVPIHNYDRFENSYCESHFNTHTATIRREGEELKLEFKPNL